MSVGRIKTISTIPTVPGARKITYGKGDLGIYRIIDQDDQTLIRYIVDPREFYATDEYTVTGRIRGTGDVISSTSENISVVSAVPSANNMEAFVCTGSGTSGGGISLLAENYPMTTSFSYACVFTLSQAWIDAKHIIRLMVTIDRDANVARFFAGLTTGVFYFGPLAYTATAAFTGVTITAGVPIIMVGTYDNITKVSKLYIRTGGVTVTRTNTAADAHTPASTDALAIAGAGPLANGLGHNGNLFKSYFFSSALSATQVDDAITALKVGYAAA